MKHIVFKEVAKVHHKAIKRANKNKGFRVAINDIKQIGGILAQRSLADEYDFNIRVNK